MVLPPVHVASCVREIAPREPLETLETLREDGAAWLLDSALRSPLGRHSFAGADPWGVLRLRGARLELECRRAVRPGLRVGRHSVGDDLATALRSLLPRLGGDPAACGLPFLGGAVGWLGYELSAGFEPRALAPAGPGHPDLALLLVDALVAWDHVSGRVVAAGLGFAEDEPGARRAAEQAVVRLGCRLDAARRRGRGRVAAAPAAPVGMTPRAPEQLFDEAAYAKSVDAIGEQIAAGGVYQACLTQRAELDFRGDPWDLYRALRRLNPAPFAAFVELPEVAVVGSSPERFLRIDPAGRVESRPIKGTRPRGRDPGEDAALRADLAGSQKDRAENLMIVDLVRNDLGRVCEPGSVEVPELMAVEEYASVFQLVSTVTGRLRPECDAFDAVRAAFPPGSMTGAPKIAAMNLLASLEPVRRGIYSGCLGYWDARGGVDLSVVIRTLLVSDGRVWLHSGGGIVADSRAEEEWLESLDKARLLLVALHQAARGADDGEGGGAGFG